MTGVQTCALPILEAGASQAVRVQYTGTVGADQEQAFRIIAEQLPIDFSGGEHRTGINVLFRYEGSVYVRPEGTVSEIILAETSRRFDEDRFLGLLVRFENRGTAHGIMDDLTITLTRSNGDDEADVLTYREDDLDVVGGTNVLAGRAVEELIDLPDSWRSGEIDVQYDVEIVE